MHQHHTRYAAALSAGVCRFINLTPACLRSGAVLGHLMDDVAAALGYKVRPSMFIMRRSVGNDLAHKLGAARVSAHAAPVSQYLCNVHAPACRVHPSVHNVENISTTALTAEQHGCHGCSF